MEGFTFISDAANHATWRGLETGFTTVVDINVTAMVVVLHTAGHKFWSGRGEQSYAPARYDVYKMAEYEPMMGGLHRVKCGERVLGWPAEKSAWPGVTVVTDSGSKHEEETE